MGTVEQQVSDLEDVLATTAPWVGALEDPLKKALDRLESFENQGRPNMRIVGLKEGTYNFFEKWIPDVLIMQKCWIKIERAHHSEPLMRVRRVQELCWWGCTTTPTNREFYRWQETVAQKISRVEMCPSIRISPRRLWGRGRSLQTPVNY